MKKGKFSESSYARKASNKTAKEAAWKYLKRWIEAVERTNTLHQRHAKAMQLLMLLMAVMLPANWIYLYLTMHLPPTGWRKVLFAADLATAAAALASLLLVRKRKPRLAVMTYLAVLLGGIAVGSLTIGLQALMFDQTYALLSLVIGGLVLGHRALWVIFLALLGIFAMGMVTDAHRHATDHLTGTAFGNAPSALLSYLVITVVIDRCLHALLTALEESRRRGEQLQTEIAKRERTQSRLFHAQKMEAVGRVAGGIAHDFDNVLSVILGYATAGERLAGKGISALLEALLGIEQATRRAMKLSRRLLTFSRDDPGDSERFDACEVLRDCIPMLRQLCGVRVRVELTCPEGAPLPLYMDRGRFELMLLNLASNARDAMPDGGRLDITAQHDTASTHALFVFKDTGIGMEKVVAKRIFEPFYTTKPAHSGTGLGLDAVSRLVREYGGRITVDSAPGQGSAFSLHIPLAGV